MGRKRNISNQNKTCAAKVVKKDDEKHDENASMNPLFMTEVLPRILDYLEIDHLKESRLVCKLWGFEGGKILLKKSNVKLKSFATTNKKNSEEREQLENFLGTKGDSATFNLAIVDMENPDSLKNILPLLLERTTTLSLKCFDGPENNTTLAEFLEFFPNIKILHFGSYWGTLEDFSVEIKKSLVTQFEALKEIRLELFGKAPHHLINLLLTKDGLAVKEVYLPDGSPITFYQKYLESNCNWPIDTLVLENGPRSPVLFFNTIQPFLEKISGSLKHLRWAIDLVPLPAKYLIPWANILINPSAFSQLQNFIVSIHGWNSTSEDFSWLLLNFALQLPNLKKLTLKKVPKNLEERIRGWNEHPGAAGRTLKSGSLEELELVQTIYQGNKISVDSFFVFSRRVWPNLKSLWIENPPHNLPTFFLLSEWIGLERLDLKFEKMSQDNVALWTKWLTGGESSKDATFSLKDLKDLKHFGLWEPRIEHSNCIATDFLVDNSLKFMTQLQSLYLKNSKISRKVKKTLKEALGPNVNVEFEK